ncbi:MAG: alanine:cation symporter family protein, partial [Oscillospiraceae bacterium]|nr:alanine:cation symporter family protein [Oscillospiraceae bacterium]
VFTAILKGAPRPEAMAWGFRRGIVSNEAGVGSSPIAHAENRGKTPREEGALGVIEVAFDTLLISTFSGLMLLTSGTEELPALWPSRALSSALGGSAPAFTAVSIALFAFSSVLSWSIYGEKSFAYLTGGRGIALYRAAFVFTAAASAMMSFDSAVAVSDLMNAVMALPNLAGLLMLAPSVRKETFSR